ACIPGPEGSVYEGGMFNVEIVLGHDYPYIFRSKVLFQTRIYHMNISEKGNVCIDILKNNWSPALSIFKVVLSLSSLLTDPNPCTSFDNFLTCIVVGSYCVSQLTH
ncbi:ubiquitin-conjugating enzyme/RWD-like protein, partial [Lactifluus volemus]